MDISCKCVKKEGLAGWLPTSCHVPPLLVRRAEPVSQQAPASHGFGVRGPVEVAEVGSVGEGVDLGSEDDDVELLVGPGVFGFLDERA